MEAKRLPVLGVPVLTRGDLLRRCLESIDYPIGKLVIVNNGNDEGVLQAIQKQQERTAPRWQELVHIRHPNAGVAGSWNEIIMLFPAPFWMLAGSDIQFGPGDLGRMAAAAWTNHKKFAAFFGNHEHSLLIQTARGTEKVGLYDFNLYPAYLEDCDWMRRLLLAGEKYLRVPEIKALHGEPDEHGILQGSRTIHSSPRLREENFRTHANNFKYYLAKWGGLNGAERFRYPFNNPNLPLDYIRYLPRIRAQQQWRIA